MGHGCSSTKSTKSTSTKLDTPGEQPSASHSVTSSSRSVTSASRTITASRSSALGQADLEVTARAVDHSELQSHLSKWMQQGRDAEDRQAFSKTLQKCIEVLAEGIGGAILVVLHEDIINQELMDFTLLDGGVLHQAMQSMVTNINEQPDAFKKVLEVLSSHTESDRWEQENIVKLVQALPGASEVLPSLLGQPKDGAILISHLGVIHGATLQLKATSSKKAILKKANGTAAGTRHNSSLSAAYWLSEDPKVKKLNLQTPGVVITRSDAGGAHCFVPQHNAPPEVLHFETIHHLSQAEMLKHFGDKIKREGLLMRRRVPALGRLGIHGEHVVTVVGGRKTSEMTVDGDKTHMVLRASTPDQEHYVLPMEKFKRLYLSTGVELDELDGAKTNGPFMQEQMRQLKAKGFKLYEPRPDNRRYIYKVTEADLRIIVTRAFISSWGAVQPVQGSDYLASPENASEIYLMPEEVVKSGYAECDVMTRTDSHKLLRKNSNGVKVWSQEEMIDKYGEIVKEKGKLMVKNGRVLMRQAKRDESVITCINGRVTASTLVTDDQSKVVLGDLHELYALSKAKVEENYEDRAHEIIGNEPIDLLFKSQGFKVYTPKRNPKYFYKIQAEDVDSMPKAFQTAFGNVQGPEVGDYLVMPDISACEGKVTPEIYMMPEDNVLAYRPLIENNTSSKSVGRSSMLNTPPVFGHMVTGEIVRRTVWTHFPWANRANTPGRAATPGNSGVASSNTALTTPSYAMSSYQSSM